MKRVSIAVVWCVLCFWASTSMAGWVSQRTEVDWFNDGTVDYVYTFTYDSNGNPTQIDGDSDNDGFIDAVEYLTYDSNGNMIFYEYDIDNDGFIDEVRFLTYDSNGNNTRIEIDTDNDGVIDEVGYRTYNSSGYLIRLEIDTDNDGVIDQVESYINDPNGNMIIFEYDENNDGSIDVVGFATNDSNGNMTSLEVDTDNDGSIDYADYRTYDLNENLLKREVDIDYDGEIELVYNHTSWIYIQGPGEPGVPWVQISGEVSYNGVPMCAMVLANGQYMFTCDPVGEFSMSVPLNAQGEITLFAFCSGLAPFTQVLTYEEAGYLDISMELPGPTPPMNVTYQLSPSFSNPDWITISGQITAWNGTPLCAMVLANGQYMFSCSPVGEFSLDVPLGTEGEIILYVFCDGQKPFLEIIYDIPVFPDTAEYAGTYSGTFNGDDWGTWTVNINSYGIISGSYYSQQFFHTISIFGSVDTYGTLTMATGGTSNSATFVGTVNSSGHVSGTWNNPVDGYSGTFSGNRNN